MKREGWAFIFLLLLFTASIVNNRSLDKLTNKVLGELEISQKAAESGDFDSALKFLNSGLNRWLSSDGYTHIFLRHTEIDSTADAFYELSELLQSDDKQGFTAAYEKLIYHLVSIDDMEHLTIRSIM